MENRNERLGASIEQSIQSGKGFTMISFTAPHCSLCKPLLEFVEKELLPLYENSVHFHVDLGESPEISTRYSIFSVPALLVFLEGREWIRKAGIISRKQLKDEMERLHRISSTP